MPPSGSEADAEHINTVVLRTLVLGEIETTPTLGSLFSMSTESEDSVVAPSLSVAYAVQVMVSPELLLLGSTLKLFPVPTVLFPLVQM